MSRNHFGAGRAVAAAALAYVLFAIFWAGPSSLSPRHTIPDFGDPLHLSWVMAWDAHQIVRHPLALFEANTFYPYPHSLAFGDHLLPEALMVAPFFWATGNAVLASNMAVLLALALSSFTLFLLLREETGSTAGAFLGGLFYAFNTFTRSETLRVQVLNMQWWPLALLFLLRFVRRGRARDAVGLAAAILLQGLSGTYYLVYTAMLGPLWLLLGYAGVGRAPSRREWVVLLSVFCGAALLMVPILWPYLRQLRAMGFEKPLREGADVLSYWSPVPHSLPGSIWFLLPQPGVPHFLGWIGTLLMAGGAWSGLRSNSPRRLFASLATLTFGAGFLLSLGPDVVVHGHRIGPGPYALLYEVFPPSRGMASPVRAAVLVLLGGALLLGLGAAAALEHLSRTATIAALLVLSILLPLEHWSPATTGVAVPTGDEIPAVYRFLSEEPPGPMADLPLYPDVAKRFWAVYLYLSTYHWRPIPIGRTSFYPPAHDYLAWSLRGFPDDLSIRLLMHLGIRTLVVHPFVWEDPADRARRIAALDGDPRLRLVKVFSDVPKAAPVLKLGEERLYRIVAPTEGTTPLCAPSDEVPRTGWVLRGTSKSNPARAIDGNRKTAWSTAPPQSPGDHLEVTFPGKESLSAVTIDLWYPHTEFPRNLVLFIRGADGVFRRTPFEDGAEVRGALLDELVSRPKEATMVLRFPETEGTGFRLMVGLRERDLAWSAFSVPELHAYRACR